MAKILIALNNKPRIIQSISNTAAMYYIRDYMRRRAGAIYMAHQTAVR